MNKEVSGGDVISLMLFWCGFRNAFVALAGAAFGPMCVLVDSLCAMTKIKRCAVHVQWIEGSAQFCAEFKTQSRHLQRWLKSFSISSLFSGGWDCFCFRSAFAARATPAQFLGLFGLKFCVYCLLDEEGGAGTVQGGMYVLSNVVEKKEVVNSTDACCVDKNAFGTCVSVGIFCWPAGRPRGRWEV